MFVLIGGLLIFLALQYIAPPSSKPKPNNPSYVEYKANPGGRAPERAFHPVGFGVTVADDGKMSHYTQVDPVYTVNGIPTSIRPQEETFELE